MTYRNEAHKEMAESLKRHWRSLGITQDEIHRDVNRVQGGETLSFLPDYLFVAAAREYWSELERERKQLERLKR